MMRTIILLLLSSAMSVNSWAAEALNDDALYRKIRERFSELSLPETTPTIVHVSDENGLTEAVKNENISEHKVICVSGGLKLSKYLSLNIASEKRVTIVGVTEAGEFKYATITGKGIVSESAGQVDIANLYLTNIERDTGAIGNAISLERITGNHQITSVTIDNCKSTADNQSDLARGGAIGVVFASGSKPSVLIYNTTVGENCVATYSNAAPLYASDARTVSLINCTIVVSDGKDKYGNDVKKNVYWLPSSLPKEVTNVIFNEPPTVTIKNESPYTEWAYKVESNLVWINDGVNLPHYESATTPSTDLRKPIRIIVR